MRVLSNPAFSMVLPHHSDPATEAQDIARIEGSPQPAVHQNLENYITTTPEDQRIEALYSDHPLPPIEEPVQRRSFRLDVHELSTWLDRWVIISQWSPVHLVIMNRFQRWWDEGKLSAFAQELYSRDVQLITEESLVNEADRIFKALLDFWMDQAPQIIEDCLLKYLPNTQPAQIAEAIQCQQKEVRSLIRLTIVRTCFRVVLEILKHLPIQNELQLDFSRIASEVYDRHPECI